MPKPPRTGRPRLDPDDRAIQFSIRLPPKHYDALYKRATEARQTISEFVRRRLGDPIDRPPR